MTLKDVKYTAHATARGQGRNGEVKSHNDAGLTLRLAMPKSLGGKGDGQNPEQLFAMGYSGNTMNTHSSSLARLVASKKGREAQEQARNAVVHTDVHMGEPKDLGGYGLAVDVKVEGVDDEELIQAGHEACPYSRALKHGAVVKVSKA
ncbi:OsmC-like protein [Gloeophyllum trabeum ATCC 11539]|uniref:OsmC-like protein n=1 Tax=Gloeophyllum trabeum (strain ATCC 11539 / FP-39264 / Madison 617) TaxID=670483 RepID=S7QC33_GLOTA|nr:OsmC-like protein [Gloeophyllum trabeum ATCC 11539]EPQ56918.1 OsmC-like protein [Gloeophyllum trabeum ATCC 11539]